MSFLIRYNGAAPFGLTELTAVMFDVMERLGISIQERGIFYVIPREGGVRMYRFGIGWGHNSSLTVDVPQAVPRFAFAECTCGGTYEATDVIRDAFEDAGLEVR